MLIDGVIGTYFFENGTIKEELYKNMWSQNAISRFSRVCPGNIFMQMELPQTFWKLSEHIKVEIRTKMD